MSGGQTRLSDEQHQHIYALWLRRTPVQTIAEQVGCHRNSVRAVVERIRSEQATDADLERARADALSCYDLVLNEAWTRFDQCDPMGAVAVGYLNVILKARERQDRIQNLEKVEINHTALYLTKIEQLLQMPAALDSDDLPLDGGGDGSDGGQ
jgi:hypothetical protein